ncbi:hypothetical protein B7R22_10000 [Subtercola boreus]|uniref:Uncharacterized protein n=1 Tax=Subtercola boreus TaxID=120213 RepID=A0A3E0VVT6_9MICO|nr:hypothetical protein [Subtercola boreus]RFA13956.1 hypothetical protein B7R22_10000 [Subtercola boreus]
MPDLRQKVPLRAFVVSLAFGLLVVAFVALHTIVADAPARSGYDGLFSALLVLLSLGFFVILAAAASLLAWPLAIALVDVARPHQLVRVSALAALAVLIGAVPSALLGSVVTTVAGDARTPVMVVVAAALSALVTGLLTYGYLRRATWVAKRRSDTDGRAGTAE